MAYADISYFGDSGGSFGGKPAWRGRVTSASELDRFDWGEGRKSPFGGLGGFGSRSASDMDRLIEDALKKRERRERLRGGIDKDDLVKQFNKKDNKVGGAAVGIVGSGDAHPNDMTFDVSGGTTFAQFPFTSRLAFDTVEDELSFFLRMINLSGQGRIVNLTSEQKVPVYRQRKGMWFYLEREEQKLKIKGCEVFLGCIGQKIKCDDVEIEDKFDGTMYAHVDFSDGNVLPKLTVDDDDQGYEGGERREDVFTFPLYEFKEGALVKGNPGGNPIILPTYTWVNLEEDE